MPDLTSEQLQIIDAPIENILVSAAAGSGKTTVLVERILTKLINGDFDIDRILVATFTNDAAANMKRKIQKAIRDKLSKLTADNSQGDPETIARLKLQLDNLPNAYIQTLNSFCSRVIREKGYICEDREGKALLDPSAMVLDENELKLLLRQACEDAIRDSYFDNSLTPEERKNFLKLTELYGDGRNDNSLAESLQETYKKLRSLPDYLDIIKTSCDTAKADDENGILRAYDSLFRDLSVIVTAGINDIALMEEATNQAVFLKDSKKSDERRKAILEMIYSYKDYFTNCQQALDKYFASDKSSIKEDTQALFVAMRELPNCEYVGIRNSSASEGIDEVIQAIAPIAKMVLLFKNQLGLKSAPAGYTSSAKKYVYPKETASFLSGDYNESLERQAKRTAITISYCKLLTSVDERFSSLKEKVSGMDFSDQEHIAYSILKLDEAKSFYKEKFAEIYIDEYQDNSSLEDAIIDTFANNNVFRVGDVKQSIYKFRYANPKLFLKRMDDYSQPNNGKLFLLSKNFRSTPEILDFVNGIFEQVMTKDAIEVEYDKKQRLNHPKGEASGFVPRVLLINMNEEKQSIEKPDPITKQLARCQGVLKEVKAYKAQGFNNDDICILSRTRKMAAEFAGYLNSNGISAQVVEDKSIFDDKDIHGICGLIIALSNELRDEYLLGVLLAGYRFSNFTLDEVAKLRAFGGLKNSLISNLRAYAEKGPQEDIKQRVETFLSVYDDIRSDLILTDIGELVERLYRETGIRATLYEQDDRLGIEKLNIFKDWLCANYIRLGSDIAQVADRLEESKTQLKFKAGIRIEENASNKVTCMTVHSSKGLEYPCVICADMDSGVNGGAAGAISFDSDVGFVVKDFDENKLTLTDSVESYSFVKKDTMAENAETARLLYVALTRAKERLSIVSDICNTDKKREMLSNALNNKNLQFDLYYWLSIGKVSILDVLLTGIIRSEEGKKILQIVTDENNEFGNVCSSAFKGFKVEIGTPLIETTDVVINGELEEGSFENAEDSEDEEDSAEIKLTNEDLSSGTQIKSAAKSTTADGHLIFDDYPYEKSVTAPFKMSVSQLSSYRENGLISLNLEVSSYEDYKEDSVLMTSAGRGTFTHKLMRFVDLNKLSSKEEYENQLDRMIENRTLYASQKSEALALFDSIVGFKNSSLGQRLLQSDAQGLAEYEKPIVFSIPLDENDPDNQDFSLVQGIIDLIFIENGEAVILDYKTDSLKECKDSNQRASLSRERHSAQLELYAGAIEAAGIKVKEKYVWLVKYAEAVKL